MIDRFIKSEIVSNLGLQKVGILLGARRVGKTHLLRSIVEEKGAASLWLNGEDQKVQAVLKERSVAHYKNLLAGKTLLVIDEAQHIQDIGAVVKLMIDEIKPLHILITGSSAFDLARHGYPLVGRSLNYLLYPLSQGELARTENLLQTRERLPERLVYGGYPELWSFDSNAKKEQYLLDLVQHYLLKDILEFEQVRSPAVLRKLLVLLAHQTGQEVSDNELATTLAISKNTVNRYLDLLQKVFVIFSLGSYSGNLRKEVSKGKKWYFMDLGIRNAVIRDFSQLPIRQDTGRLWENYCIVERMKHNQYNRVLASSYFWRTYDQQEIDYLEVLNGGLQAAEIKWKPGRSRIPKGFIARYPDASFLTIHPGNYLEWIQ